ncbi:MAG TPA: FG-GAP-like repeat-containing protein [Vicinamibacterales bacterium]|nr:FG-GAP-like repeat-containing protein [Vicinamibacterales bacterium]
MNIRAKRAVWLIALGALAASEIRPRTHQLTGGPTQVTRADEVTLRVIVVDSAEKAQRIVTRLDGGEDFIALAQAESIDPTATAGGLLGKVTLSTLPAVLKDALVNVVPGQLSPVVHIPTGFAVLKVVDDTDPASRNMNAASPATLATQAGVRYVIDVSGLIEAEAVLQAFPKPADWNQDPRTICQMRRQSLASSQRSLEDFLSPERQVVRAVRAPFDVMQAHFALAQLHAYHGHMDRALDQYRRAYETARAGVPAAALRMEEALGVAYLHRSGMENGAHRAPGDICLFPWRPDQSYARTEDSERAIEHFLEFLTQKPDDLEVRWLLNLAYMTIGRYPSGVPPAYLIPPAAFPSTEDVGRFRDVAPRAGLNVVATAGGVIVDDFAGNGRFDVVTSNFDSCGPMHYFRNNGDGTFTERTSAAGLDGQLGGLNMIQTDYNNDGCKDILVLRGGWQMPQRNSLLRNNCDGTFTDVTAASGLADPATSSQTAAWADINNDGLLDLFVGNEDRGSQLFLNKGGTYFEEISRSAGVDRAAFTKGVSAADYDNDGFVDLYVSNFKGSNFLYRNNHDNTFTEMARAAGVPGPGYGFATWFFDYDNDGWSDLFATSYFTSVDESVRTYLGLAHNAATLKLYRNQGDGRFRDVTMDVGLDKVFMPMGANFGDIDNDGFLDIHLGTGNPSYASLLPNVLLRNNGGTSFVDVTGSSGTGELHKGHGIAFADLDNDGDEEIVAEIGGATPGDSHPLRLFENPGHGNDWINLRLVGVKSNRAAIGARVKLTVEHEGGETRAIHRSVGSGGSFGASPLEQHVGLGKSARIVELEVRWPGSNTRQRVTGLGKNQSVEITELTRSYTVIERRPITLGGTRKVQ